MFSCEYKNTCFEEQLPTAASENNKKRFLGKTTDHNDHYIVNIDGQRPKIDRWPPLICSVVVICFLLLFFFDLISFGEFYVFISFGVWVKNPYI